MTDVDFTNLSAHNSAEESPGLLLWQVSTRWRRLLEGTLKDYGLTHPQFVILAAVGWMTRGGATTTQAKIGQHAELDPNTTSQILRTLQRKGLIDRVPGADERTKSPILTARGAALLEQALPAVEAVDAEFFGAVDLKTDSAMDALKTLASVSA